MADLLQGLAELAQQRDGVVPAEQEARERDRFVGAMLAGVRPERPRLGRSVAVLAAAAAVVVIALLVWPASDLTFEVHGGAIATEGYVSAGEHSADIAFSDGTTVTLDAGGSSRLVEIDDRGARVLLERGRAQVDVHHLPDASWAFAAGPYTVRVTGTRFDLSWDPTADIFELALHEGAVEVRGPQLQDGLRMHAGQRLVATGSTDVQLRELESLPPPEAKASARPAPTAATAAAEPSASVTAPPEPKAPTWAQLIARGDYRRVLDEAEARGLEAVLASGNADEVMALGEAARYSGDGALGRRALLALRDRFAASPAAKTAAFLLGRMAEPSASAITWYDRYLAEAPGGAYAPEALGRKLALLSKSDRAAARQVAKQYLATYPKGAYAELARQLGR